MCNLCGDYEVKTKGILNMTTGDYVEYCQECCENMIFMLEGIKEEFEMEQGREE